MNPGTQQHLRQTIATAQQGDFHPSTMEALNHGKAYASGKLLDGAADAILDSRFLAHQETHLSPSQICVLAVESGYTKHEIGSAAEHLGIDILWNKKEADFLQTARASTASNGMALSVGEIKTWARAARLPVYDAIVVLDITGIEHRAEISQFEPKKKHATRTRESEPVETGGKVIRMDRSHSRRLGTRDLEAFLRDSQ